MASKKEVVCIFCVTTSTITKRRFYDVFRVEIIIERAATSSKSSMKYLHASVACIKVFWNNYSALIQLSLKIINCIYSPVRAEEIVPITDDCRMDGWIFCL